MDNRSTSIVVAPDSTISFLTKNLKSTVFSHVECFGGVFVCIKLVNFMSFKNDLHDR